MGRNYNRPIIISTHPRTMSKIQNKKKLSKKIIFLKPMNFSDYNCLQVNSYAVLSDSGTITEETSILNLAKFNIEVSSVIVPLSERTA